MIHALNYNINQEIISLINSQKKNFPLDQKFYIDNIIFEKDIEHIFSNQWVFVGHVSRIPNIGDYFTISIGDESIIVIRDKKNIINCFYNVCRHRGSHICLESEGSVRKLICPYHAWTYNLDGALKNASMMNEDFKKEDWSLIKCNKNIFEGLIFINLSNKPTSFTEFIKPLEPFISLHGLDRAKIAIRKEYEIEGNWKLALDNFHECYGNNMKDQNDAESINCERGQQDNWRNPDEQPDSKYCRRPGNSRCRELLNPELPNLSQAFSGEDCNTCMDDNESLYNLVNRSNYMELWISRGNAYSRCCSSYFIIFFEY